MADPQASSEPVRGAPITGLSHVQLVVGDLRASAAWYGAVLGLDQTAAGDGYVALAHRRARLVIVLSTPPDDADGPPRGTGSALDHLAFAVPDGETLAEWADHLRRVGVHHDGIVLENGNPSLPLSDPDGNAIELVAPGRRVPGATSGGHASNSGSASPRPAD